MEPWYNPFIEEQAIARAWRNGQTKKVHVLYIIIKDTVEDRVLEIADRKKAFIQRVLNRTCIVNDDEAPKLDKQTISRLLE